MRLISHRLTPIHHLDGIHGLITFGKLMQPPRVFSALPPSDSHEASPKAISGRTSYLRVRLEFLRYPHLIPTLFNGCGFGPPWPFTATSSWTWIGHPVSGLRIPNFALFRLGFPPAPRLKRLTIPVSAARRTVLQKVRRYTCGRCSRPSCFIRNPVGPSALRLPHVQGVPNQTDRFATVLLSPPSFAFAALPASRQPSKARTRS